MKVDDLAAFVARAKFSDLTDASREALKIRLLDSLACAIGALDSHLMAKLREQQEDFNCRAPTRVASETVLRHPKGAKGLCSLIGGGKSAPDRAAFFNGALVRYLDYNDSFLAKRETCHPSDNIGALLAAAEYADATGEEFLCALAISYQVQCRLSEEAPVRHKGFDHTVQGAYSVAAGVAKALRLSPEKIAHAISMAAVGNNALRVTRTGALSHWKGLAFASMAFMATHASFLAMRGVTGPLEIFEGNKGFMESISGPFHIDWERENLEIVRQTIIKKYNAEIHSQSAIEAILELRARHQLRAEEVDRIEVAIFDVAYHIIGGGEEGDKARICTKEEADHSLTYMLAVALLDGNVQPEQYAPERIARDDVQSLFKRVHIRPDAEASALFPKEMRVTLTVTKRDGQVLKIEKSDYEGFVTRPMSWEGVVKKYKRFSSNRKIVEMVSHLESVKIRELMNLLRKAKKR